MFNSFLRAKSTFRVEPDSHSITIFYSGPKRARTQIPPAGTRDRILYSHRKCSVVDRLKQLDTHVIRPKSMRQGSFMQLPETSRTGTAVALQPKRQCRRNLPIYDQSDNFADGEEGV
jgi:hypothetical protein